MRNIYDIINEQKATIDAQLASYDLEYTIEHLQSNEYYLQEGAGETIKSMVEGFVKFIKSLIQKLREFINRVFGFFRVKNNTITEMEKQIEEANKEFEKKREKHREERDKNVQEVRDKMEKQKKTFEEQEKEMKERRKKEDEENRKNWYRKDEKNDDREDNSMSFDLGTPLKDLKSILKEYTREVTISYACGPLGRRVDFINLVTKAFDHAVIKRAESVSDLTGNLLSGEFKDKVFDDPDIKDYKSEIMTLCYDEKDATVQVTRLAGNIIDYLYNKDDFLKTVRSVEKYTQDVLERQIKIVKDNASNETVGRKFITEFQNLSTIVASVLNFICVTTMKGYDEYVKLAQLATNDYVRSLARASGKYYPDED